MIPVKTLTFDKKLKEFGFGLGHDIIPYFSRKIGLLQGQPVPLLVGGKLDGKVGNTNFGGLVTHMGKVDSLVNQTTLGVVRVKQNIWKESTIGFLTTVGDPQGRPGSYTAGLDFTYKTSSFRGDKNFLIGVWSLTYLISGKVIGSLLPLYISGWRVMNGLSFPLKETGPPFLKEILSRIYGLAVFYLISLQIYSFHLLYNMIMRAGTWEQIHVYAGHLVRRETCLLSIIIIF